MTDLQTLVQKHSVNQAALARTISLSPRSFARMVHKGCVTGLSVLQKDTLYKVLMSYGAQRKEAAQAADVVLTNTAKTTAKNVLRNTQKKSLANTGLASDLNNEAPESSDQTKLKDNIMLPRKCVLSPSTKAHFGLPFDPLNAQLLGPKDVFLSPDMRVVLETLNACAKNGGALALVGESGSGKTTLKQMLAAQLGAADSRVTYIEPYVLAMEDNDQLGKTLKSLAIAYAIIKKLEPLAKPKREAQARFEQLHTLLQNNKAGGNHTVLVIEEAHALPIPTLKHLKRFLEMPSDGFRPLISVILIGQPELAMRLNPKNMETREVSQRFEIMTVPPLNAQATDFLKHQFKKADTLLDAVFDKGAVDALVARLGGNGTHANHLYPLALCNLAASAMNAAAGVHAPKVSADMVRGAQA